MSSAAWLGLKRGLDVWLDALFPPRCVGCGQGGAHFCSRCVGAVRAVPEPICPRCGRTATQLGGAEGCPECVLRPMPLAAVRGAGVFEGSLRKAVHAFKYRGRRHAGAVLGDLMVAPTRQLIYGWPREGVLVVPVPLHPRRLAERGYNQAALLAAPVAAALRVPLATDALRRVKDTESLIRLNRPAREREMHGAFAAIPEVAGKRVVLVDDVATTCSTLSSAARSALDAGAKTVVGVTLAREQ